MARGNSFEKNLKEIDLMIKKLESGELTLEDSIKEYEKTMKLIKKSSDMLNKAEGKILKIREVNGEIILEEEE